MSRAIGAIRALRHHNYQLFFGGQLISLIGTWMQNVAQSWLVYRLTGQAEVFSVEQRTLQQDVQQYQSGFDKAFPR